MFAARFGPLISFHPMMGRIEDKIQRYLENMCNLGWLGAKRKRWSDQSNDRHNIIPGSSIMGGQAADSLDLAPIYADLFLGFT